MITCNAVTMDKGPGVRPIGIEETICRAISKLVMRGLGDQVKTACGILQLCADLDAGIEKVNHDVDQTRRERTVLAPA